VGTELYAGNLARGVTGDLLKALFSAHGTVRCAEVVTHRVTGCSRGFGFVTMATAAQARG
jgi:hypothetical protein